MPNSDDDSPLDLNAYRAAKAAAGGSGRGSGGSGQGSGGSGGGFYRPGQNVICKILRAEPGGYTVLVARHNLTGYMPARTKHNIGDEVLVTFVCFDKNRALFAERFSSNLRQGWEQALEDETTED